MVANVTASVNLADAAVSVVVTGWFNSVSVTGSVVDGAATFTRGDVGTQFHTVDLAVAVESLRIQLDGLNSGGNDLDLYLYRDVPLPVRLVASAANASAPDELIVTGKLAAGRYTVWVHGLNAVPATGTPYTLVLTGCPATGSPVTGFGTPISVRRVATDITGAQVETDVLGTPVSPAGGRATMWDSVAPLGTAVFYRVRETMVVSGVAGTPSGATPVVLTSNTVTITGQGDGWLKDPAQPVNDVHLVPGCVGSGPPQNCSPPGGITFQALADETFESSNGVFDIINAARDRVVSQLRQAARFALTLVAHRLADAYSVEVLLRSGRVLCLQLDPQYGFGYDTWNTDYVNVDDVKRGRIASNDMRYVERLWTLPLRLVGAPAITVGRTAGNGIGVKGTTYSAGTASGRTYAVRTATGNTYVDSTLGRGL